MSLIYEATQVDSLKQQYRISNQQNLRISAQA